MLRLVVSERDECGGAASGGGSEGSGEGFEGIGDDGGAVEGELVVSVPARDVLYVTGDASPENLSELRGWTSKMLEQADKPLSRVFLRRNGTQWEPYTGFAD